MARKDVAPQEQTTDHRAVEAGDVVLVHYTGRLEDNSVFDSTEGREPLSFEAGAGEVIKGFDEGVLGMHVGQRKTVIIPPEEGYGPWQPDLLTQMDRALAGESQVLPGMLVQVRTPEDEILEATITEVGDETLTLDFNHPLAGKVLTFDITVVGVEGPEAGIGQGG